MAVNFNVCPVFKGSNQNVNFYNNTDKVSKYNIFNNSQTDVFQSFGSISKKTANIKQKNIELKTKYGIKSDIKNPKILNNIETAINDFCRINNNKKLFEGLETSERELNPNQIYQTEINPFSKKMKLYFNSNFNWDNISDYTKERYDIALNGSKNPNYPMYKALGSFITFNNAPLNYINNKNVKPADTPLLKIRRFCNSNNVTDFSINYIASNMSGEYLPKVLDKYYKQIDGNYPLKFPEVNIKNKPETEFKFNDLNKAGEFLLKEYGIETNFNNLTFANECILAVEELTNAMNDKNIFNGLRIITTPVKFNRGENVPMKTCFFHQKQDAVICVNPNYDVKTAKNELQKTFDNGILASNKIKNSFFIHEFAHWLDFKGNPQKFYDEMSDIENGKLKSSDEDKQIMGRVSFYAAEDPHEFCAEYISGRLDGNTYPEVTNKKFKELWKGKEINFSV